MFGLSTRRSAATRSKCLSNAPTSLCSSVRSPAHRSLLSVRDFHPSQHNAAFRPTWMPMRVKTPWIDALTKSRETAKSGQGAAAPSAKPDLTPKKMSDSYYSAVGAFTDLEGGLLLMDVSFF